MTRTNAVLAAIAAVLSAAVVIAVVRRAQAPGVPAPRSPPAGAAAGSWEQYCVGRRRKSFEQAITFTRGRFDGCYDMEAGRHILADEVWCRWVGPNVLVHLRLRNTRRDSTLVEVTPRYVAAGAQHGAFQGSSSLVTLAADEMTTVDLPAGAPQATPVGAPISACAPRLEDARPASASPAR